MRVMAVTTKAVASSAQPNTTNKPTRANLEMIVLVRAIVLLPCMGRASHNCIIVWMDLCRLATSSRAYYSTLHLLLVRYSRDPRSVINDAHPLTAFKAKCHKGE